MVAFVASTVLTAANLNTAFNALTIRTVTGTSDTLVLADNGGAVTYSNAAATTSTIPPNSSVAYAVGTRIELMNLGAGVVTVTAGAGVTVAGTLTMAQNTGGVCVKTATNTWSFYQISASNPAGMDLITPTSVAGTGVTVSGGQVTFTAATTVSLNGCFTAAYDNYQIVISGVGSENLGVRARLRLSGTDNSASAYSGQGYQSVATLTNIATGPDNLWYFGNVHTLAFSTAGTFFSPFLAEPTQFLGSGQRRATISDATGLALVHSALTSFDGISFICSSGNITGKLRLYGMRSS